MLSKHIAITGMGLITSTGVGTEECWDSFVRGISGVKLIDRFDTSGMKTQFAAYNRNFDNHACPRDIMEEMLDRVISEAIAQTEEGHDYLVYCLPNGVYDWNIRISGKNQPKALSFNPFKRYYSESNLAERLMKKFKIKNPPIMVSTACASSATALQLAADLIQSKRAKSVVVAASDCSVCEETITKFNNLSALSRRNDFPQSASRPFSFDRDGFVIGEGAGCMVLQSEETVRESSLINGYLSGSGSSTDNYHRTKGNPDGLKIVDAMQKALHAASLSSDKIDFVSCHGTSTPENDALEAKAISILFGNRDIPVTATKSMIGHTLNASGIIQAISAVLSIKNKIITPTINYSNDNPDCYGNVKIVNTPIKNVKIKTVISNSFGFGGQNTSLVFSSSH